MLNQSGYAIFSILGYSIGIVIFMIIARSKQRHFSETLQVSFIALLASLFGAKIFHTLFEAPGHSLPNGQVTQSVFDLLRADPWHWARLFDHGHVFFGGLITTILVVSLWLRANKIDRPFEYADCFAPGLALGLALGRIGCFFAGCCFGQPSDISWLSVRYSGPLAELGPLLPIQLLESLFAFMCFVFLIYKINHTKPNGFWLFWFLFFYSIFRFFIEFLRADSDRGLWFGETLSTSQIISLIILICLGAYYSIAFVPKLKLKLS